MAKKTSFSADSYDFDKSLDIPDLDGFEFSPSKPDGKPVMRIARGVKSGFLGRLRSSEFLRTTILSALPRGYGAAYEFVDESARPFKDLYDSTVREMRPQLNELARITGRVIPKDATKDSDLLKKLRGFANTYESPQDQQQVDPKEAMVSAALGQVFDAQQQMEDRRAHVNDIKDQVREGLAQARHKDVLQELSAIRQQVTKQTSFHTTLGLNIKRKSLELQFRQYFLAMEAYAETKRSNALVLAHLDGILRNTALPDQAKLEATQEKSGIMRNRYLRGALSGALDLNRNFARNLRDSMLNRARGTIQATIGGLREGITGANMALDMNDAMGSMLDPYEMAGEFGGGELANMLGRRIGSKARDYLARNQRVRKYGNEATYFTENFNSVARNWARSDKNERGPLGILTRFLKQSILSMPGAETGLHRDSLGTMQSPAVFDRAVAKSITTVMPGYLARILQELQVMRTGDKSTQLLEFDPNTDRFKTRSQNRKDILSRLITDQGRKYTTGDINSLIDSVGGKRLTQEQREALGHHLLRENVAGNGAHPDRLRDAASYTGSAQKYARVYTDMFSQHFQGDSDSAKKAEFGSLFNGLGRFTGDGREMIQQLVNNGQLAFMQELGIVDSTGTKINLEKYYAYHYGEQLPEIDGEGVEGETRRMRSRGSAAKRRPKKPLRWAHETGRARRGSSFYTEVEVPAPSAGSDMYGDASLIEAIEKASSKTEAAQAVEILSRIEARLDAGVGTFNVPSELLERLQAGYDKATSGTRTLTGHAKHYGGKAWDYVKSLYKRGEAMFGERDSVIGKVRGARDWAMGKAQHMWTVSHDAYTGFRDVYIKGQAIPAMQAWRLKAGEYYDQASGKVIKSWKDIKGAVVDKDGNIVLSADQVKDAFTKLPFGEKAITALGAIAGKVRDRAAEFMASSGNLLNMARGKARQLYDDFIDGPVDVYLKGESDPVLTARLMKMGGVYFDRDSKAPIKKLSDIKGPVVDADGKALITAENLREGLFDINGNPLKSRFQNVKDLVVGGVKMGLGVLVGGAKRGWDRLKELSNGRLPDIGRGLKNLFDRNGFIQIGGQKTVIERLTEIRDMLDERLPGRKIRVNSLEDMANKRKERGRDDGDPKDPDGAKRGGVLGGLGGMIKSLFSRKKKSGDDEEGKKEGGGVTDAITQGVGQAVGEKVLGRFGKVLAKIPGIGRLFRGAGGAATAGAAEAGLGAAASGASKWGMLGKFGKLGLGGLALGGVASAAHATGHDTLGTAADVAGYGLTGYSLLGATAGLTGLGGGTALGLLGSALGVGGAAIASVLGSSIALPAILAAGAGYGAYKAVKYFTRDKLSQLSSMRYAQYGFLPTDTKYVHQVFAVEEASKKAVVYTSGMPNLDPKKVDWKAALEAMDVDKNDRQAVANFVEWYAKRFKPVFLVSMGAVNKVKPGVDLSDVDDKLNNSQKKEYFTIARYSSGPYNQLTSPIPGQGSLPAGPTEVQTIISGIQADIDKLPDDDKKALSSGLKAVGVAGAALAAATDGTKPLNGTQDDSAKLTPEQAKTIQSLKGVDSTGTRKTEGMVYVAAGAGAFNQSWNGRVDAVTAVRFKTYGLKEMETDKVTTLANLESLMDNGVKFSGTSNKAAWEGSLPEVIAKVGPAFGIEGLNSANATNFIQWFQWRFLPTYLNYRTALMSATGKRDAATGFAALKPADAVNVAMATYTSTTNYNGSVVSVWTIPVSPWPGYELNAEAATTDGNMKGLKDSAKSDKLAEQTAYDRKTSAANDSASADNAAGASQKTPFDGGIAASIKSGWNKVKSFLGFGGDESTGSTGSGGSMTGGQNVTMGVAEGGLASQLPNPTGKGYAAVKDLILAAAKMTGVDPKLMLSMAAIESGFDPSIKASTSSATGLYQFVSGTWQTMLKKYGAKYGLAPNTPPTDARANALMGAEFLRENAAALKGVKDNLTDTDLYAAHFLGAGGAKQLLSANPNADAVSLMPKAAAANEPIFKNKDGSHRTVAQVYAELNRRVRAAGAKYGLGADDGSESMKAAGTSSGVASGKSAGVEDPSGGGAGLKGTDDGLIKDSTQLVPTRDPSTPISAMAPSASGATGGGGARPAIPVADTTPGMQRAGDGVTPSGANTGFSAKAMDVSAQTRAQATVDTLAGVPDILNASLSVQKDQLSVLNLILKAVSEGGAAASGAGADAGTASRATPATKASTRVPDPVVDVSRKQW